MMDTMMRVMDGWKPQKHCVPLVNERHTYLGTTALFRSEDPNVFGRGCNGYIVKPLSGVDLQRRIRELLATKALPA